MNPHLNTLQVELTIQYDCYNCLSVH